MGNKGAAILRFTFEDTSFCFSNCHLEAGSSYQEAKSRHQMLQQVQKEGFKAERGT